MATAHTGAAVVRGKERGWGSRARFTQGLRPVTALLVFKQSCHLPLRVTAPVTAPHTDVNDPTEPVLCPP